MSDQWKRFRAIIAFRKFLHFESQERNLLDASRVAFSQKQDDFFEEADSLVALSDGHEDGFLNIAIAKFLLFSPNGYIMPQALT